MSGLEAPAKRIVVAPFSNSEIRDWGIANYARLVAPLLERPGCYVVLVGSKTQRDQIEPTLDENGRDRRIINVAGRCEWSETRELFVRPTS
jgi:hypothetical protein